MREIKDGTKFTGSHWKVFPSADGDSRPILLVDFDHTITTKCLACEDYTHNDVQKGCREALQELSKDFKIYIFTGNYRYIDPKAQLMKTTEDIERFLKDHQIPFHKVLQVKPPACFIIDDRAIHHTSWKRTLREITKRRQVK